ncbi:hypothetical protein OAN96_00750 [Candidatus Gracilibacteria bacterium]|nr:hypothetical protein [Candidatus Gracilibacteria bacterium]
MNDNVNGFQGHSSPKRDKIIRLLSYSHEENILDEIPENKEKYARSLDFYDLHMIEQSVVQNIRDRFKTLIARFSLQGYITDSAKQDAWIWWDIGKQLYYNENSSESHGYALGNPLTDTFVQESIMCRMLGYEIATIANNNEGRCLLSSDTISFIRGLNTVNGDFNKENGGFSSKTLESLGRFIMNGGDEILNATAETRAEINKLS